MKELEVNGRRLGFRDSGSAGAPILLVHAFPLSSAMWERQIDVLTERGRVVAPDLKGFGASSAPDDPSAYSMDSYADDLRTLLEHLDIPQAILVGLSMGGYIALNFARRHPGAVAGLVLADTRAEPDPPEGAEKRSRQQEQVRERGTEDLIKALSAALLAPSTLAGKPDVVARVTALMDNPPSGFIGALEAMKKREDSTPGLAALDAPSLVIVGEHDTITPPEAARRLHEGISGSRLVVVADAGHLTNLEAPEAFDRALAEFLDGL